jgi:hypothetical protein
VTLFPYLSWGKRALPRVPTSPYNCNTCSTRRRDEASDCEEAQVLFCGLLKVQELKQGSILPGIDGSAERCCRKASRDSSSALRLFSLFAHINLILKILETSVNFN